MRNGTSLGSFALLLGLVGCGRPQPYDDCSYQNPCGSDAPLCLSSTAASGRVALFCTRRCTTASDCPGSAVCARLNGRDPVCLKRCSAASDCDFNNAQCAALPETSGMRVCAVAP